MNHSHTLSTGTGATSYLNRLWVDIEEMPIWNWIQILETGDLKWIFKKKGNVTKRISEHWLNLQQQYIDEFGLDENYKNQLRIMKKLTLLNLEFVETRERHLLNLIKIAELDIKRTNGQKAVKFYEILDHVEKYKGFSIDPKTTSVMKWYYSLKNMSNGKAD